MRRELLLVIVGAAAGVSGCAGPRYYEALQHLKADVGLLDQRVTQLERISVEQAVGVGRPSEPLPAPAAAALAPKHARAAWTRPPKKDIQQALKAAGFYDGPIDGRLGPKTHQAIRNFQQANGLKVEGVVGRHTWEKLAPYLHAPAVTQEAGGSAASTTEQASEPFQK